MIINQLDITAVRSSVSLDQIATRVTVRFGYDWQASDYSSTVTYLAPEQVRKYGDIERIIDAPFCSGYRQACTIAAYWCARLSVPNYAASISCDRAARSVQVGDLISVSHVYLPGDGVTPARVQGREYTPETGAVDLELLLAASHIPDVVMVGYAGKFRPATIAAANYRLVAGDLLVSLTDGLRTLAGATVTLDGSLAGVTDAAGIVVFRALSAGKHQVAITAAGYQSIIVEISVAGIPVELSLTVTKTVQAVTTTQIPEEVLPA